MITFLFFPLLCIMAWMADKGVWCFKSGKDAHDANVEAGLDKEQMQLVRNGPQPPTHPF